MRETTRRDTILIVDDDPDFVYLTRRRLQHDGWAGTLDSVSDGAAALTYVKARLGEGATATLPALMLVDINMPGMGGFELLGALEVLFDQHTVQVPPPVVVMASSSRLESDRARARACRLVRGFLTKPVAAAALRTYLGGSA